MTANCQCHIIYHAGWMKDGNRNVPAWYCSNCGAFACKMNSAEANYFRKLYFAQPKTSRQYWLTSHTKWHPRQNKQLSLF